MGRVKLCWNECLIKSNGKNVIKCGGEVKLCRNTFRIKANDKKCNKIYLVVKFGWNEFTKQATQTGGQISCMRGHIK